MSNYDVTLTASTRQNLLSLQSTAALNATNQTRLSTGKKVNSALDNPVNYFTAAGLSDRASALNGLLDGISNGIQTIQAASKGIDSATSLIQSMQSTVKQAQSNAASNRPTIAGGVAFGTTGESNTTSKSIQDIAYSKALFGAPTTAGSTTAGIVGLTSHAAAATPADNTDPDNPVPAAPAKTDSVRISAGNTTYTFDLSSSSTVRDLVDNINKSGIASASVGSDGKLNVTGSGSDALTFQVGTTTAANGTTPASFAASDADTAKLFGSVNGTTVDYTAVTSSATSTVRSNLVQQFNDLRDQLDAISKDSGYNGINLLNGDKLTIAFNEKTGDAQSKLSIQGNLLDSNSLGIGSFVDSSTASTGSDFSVQNDSDLGKAADALTNALASLKSLSSTLGSNLATVQTRQDFTKNISDVLTTGASNLTDADMNAEAANSQALSTRQSLGISALSLANTANQGILQLLR